MNALANMSCILHIPCGYNTIRIPSRNAYSVGLARICEAVLLSKQCYAQSYSIVGYTSLSVGAGVARSDGKWLNC